MSANPLISVIVPIYGAEQYLDRCVESIVNQSYTNLEILLIDDESPDSCPAMCDAWAVKDHRVKVIHQQNKGPSGSRNAGLDLAEGDYISFVDSDDYIELNLFDLMLHAIHVTNSDIAILDEHNCKINTKDIKNNLATYNQEETVLYIISTLNNSPCNKLYKRNIIDKHRFYEGKTYGEDLDFLSRIFTHVRRSVLLPYHGYHYEKREGSITTSALNDKSFDELFFKDRVLQVMKDEFPYAAQYMEKYCFTARMHLLRKIKKAKKSAQYLSYQKQYHHYIKNHYKEVRQLLKMKEIALYYLIRLGIYN